VSTIGARPLTTGPPARPTPSAAQTAGSVSRPRPWAIVCHTPLLAMPKMKTHSGAKKRFKLTGTGKVHGHHAFTSHILEKKSPKRKRRLGHDATISKHDAPRVKKLLRPG
jgi:large subunit ribosomal protein L35